MTDSSADNRPRWGHGRFDAAPKITHRERREAKYAASRAAEVESEKRRMASARDGAVGVRKAARVVALPEPKPKPEAVQSLPRPARADVRMAELRAELESTRAARVVDDMNEPNDPEPEPDVEPESTPKTRTRVRVAQPLKLPTREQIAALCLDAYRLALDCKRTDRDGQEVPAPQIAAAVAALKALNEVCGYGQVRRDAMNDSERETALESTDAEAALERMRSSRAIAELPKPRF
jgi:hypothetical protein